MKNFIISPDHYRLIARDSYNYFIPSGFAVADFYEPSLKLTQLHDQTGNAVMIFQLSAAMATRTV